MRRRTLGISILVGAGTAIGLSWLVRELSRKRRVGTVHRAEAQLKMSELLEGRPSMATGRAAENG